MLYDGKSASLELQALLKEKIATRTTVPVLSVFSVATHPSIASFIAIKRKFATSIGVTMNEYVIPISENEDTLIGEIEKVVKENKSAGIIVQLPLPSHYNIERVLNTIPKELDVDCLGSSAWEAFIHNKKTSIIPPVASAIAHILSSSNIDITNKKIVVVGNGRLVGSPVKVWFEHQGTSPAIVDIHTDESTRMHLYKSADIVVSGIGVPHHLCKEYFKQGVVLIDAGTSEQSGVLAGDCNPDCIDIASLLTPVPGGVGPLTVAYLFYNLVHKQ